MIRLEGATVAVPANGSAERRAVLRDLDFDVQPGQSHLLLGVNGSGKTTLIRVLCGLAGLDQGRYLLEGAAVPFDPQGQTLWPRVAAIFEEPDPQFLTDSVEAEVAFGVESLGLPVAEARTRVEEAMRRFDLQPFRSRAPQSLSAGEKARVLLAAVTVGRPRCLLLDQSLAHLDPGSRRRLEASLVGEALSGGCAVVRTHQEAESPYAGERLHLLDAGQLEPASALSARGVLGLQDVPLPLSLRVSAALSLRGDWNGSLAITLGELRAGLEARPRPVVPPVAAAAAPATSPAAPSATTPTRPVGDDGLRGRSLVVLQFAGATWGPVERRRRPVLSGIDLEVTIGEIVGIIGRSGTGKTTLLKLAAGLLETTGGHVGRWPPAEFSERPVALAMEYPERQLFGRTVLEDVAALLWVEGVPREERERSAELALGEVGLDPRLFRDRYPPTLSEGEKRRVALAGALVEPPALLLLDEPTAGLDPGGRRGLAEALRRLKARGIAVLIASHDLDFVSMVADRVLVLARDGDEPDAPTRGFPAEPTSRVLRDAGRLAAAELPIPDFIEVEAMLRSAGIECGAPTGSADSLVTSLERR